MLVEARRELVGISTALCDLRENLSPVDDADRGRRCQGFGDDGRAALILDDGEPG